MKCNEICDKLKTTQTSKNYSFPSYFGFIQTSTIFRVHSCIVKKYSYASHAFVFGSFFFKKTTDCCCTRRLSVRSLVVFYATCDFFANTFVCAVMTNLLARFC